MTDDRRRALLATGVAAMLATLVRATSAAPLQAGTKREDMPPSPSGTKQEGMPPSPPGMKQEGMPSSRIGTKQDDTPSSQGSRKQRDTSFSPATHRTHAMTSSLHYQNAELVYRTGGQEGAPTIVLLHGGLGSMEDFAPLLPRLQQQFRTVEIDTRGHGLSTRGDAPLTYAQIADDVRHIVDAIGLAAFHLFGFSDGGTAAYRIAAEDGRVQLVLTVGAQWHSRDTPRDMFENLTVADMREHMPTQVAAYEKRNPRPDLSALVDDLRRLWMDDTAAGFPNDMVAGIGAPVLAARGEADFLLSLDALSALQKVLPDVHLMNVPFASHEVIREQPDMLWAAMKVFHAG